jgi:hypothetical protein
MRRSLLLVSIAAGAGLVLAIGALAKGPSAARIEGPGIRTLTVSGSGEDGGVSLLGQLTERSGFFPAVFGQTPDPMLRTRPRGNLGPRYTVTWSVPGGSSGTSRIRQALYPYAKPRPLTYMKPDQLFWDGQRTHGGWFLAGPSLKRTLAAVGLPARAAV